MPPSRSLTPAKPGTETPPAAPASEAQLWDRYRAEPTEAARNGLIEHYLPLVRRHAEAISRTLPESGPELDDLVAAGVFGLIEAIAAFDPARKTRFTTYCVQRVRGSMLDSLRQQDWVPRLVRQKATKLRRATEALQARLGRQPTDEELAAELQLAPPQLDALLSEATAVAVGSLSKKRFKTDSLRDVAEADLLRDRRAELPARRLQSYEALRALTRGLNRSERLIVILYYWEQVTMKEIGVALGLSESRVSQMHSSIMGRLREQLPACA